MFRCDRCGTGFNPTVASAAENCPRCRANGVESPLSFRLFEPRGGDTAPAANQTQTEETV
jgi:hypothetical protein